MLTAIKTALITITISFISGVLLDAYKNYAPRILCSIGRGTPIKLNNKRIKAYTLMIKNLSNKTLHNLTVCIQGRKSWDNLKIDEARITGGLKFDISNEEDVYNVSIPFISRNDQFTVKLFVENHSGDDNKPIITLRSPENFKRINSGVKNESSGLLSIIKQSIGNSSSYGDNNREENSSLKKKALVTTGVVLAVLCIGVFGAEYYNKALNEARSSNDKTIVNEKDSTKTSADTKSSTSNTKASLNTDKNKNSDDEDSAQNNADKSNTKTSSQQPESSSKTESNKNTNTQETKESKGQTNTSGSSNGETDKKQSQNSLNSDVKNNENTDKNTAEDKTNQEVKGDDKAASQQNTSGNESKKASPDSNVSSAGNSKAEGSNSTERETANVNK